MYPSNPRSKSPFNKTIAILLGLLLLAAAGLKLYGMNVSPFAQYGWLVSPTIQVLAVLWEIALGLWLISGVNRLGAWLAAVITFLAFAIVSGYLGVIGQASCGCFGMIKANPWWAFGVDLTALILLALTRPSWSTMRDTFRTGLPRPNGFARVILGALLVLFLLTGATTWTYGSPSAALARLRGVSLYSAGYVDFGISRPGERVEREVSVTNWTQAPIRLIGGTSDCSCVTTEQLPLTIGPGETAAVPIRLTLPTSAAGAFTRQVELWTDYDHKRTLRIHLRKNMSIALVRSKKPQSSVRLGVLLRLQIAPGRSASP